MIIVRSDIENMEKEKTKIILDDLSLEVSVWKKG